MARFIPAGAGNTFCSASACRRASVHPCGRREHLFILPAQLYCSGSSLRAQGTRSCRLPAGCPSRFIPAGAGNTETLVETGTGFTVHPCGRREHANVTLAHEHLHGSSLRAQGTPVSGSTLAVNKRFIPAGAGNTTRRLYFFDHFPVHPCGRREHYGVVISKKNKTGSSLRAQGTPPVSKN